MKEMEIANKPNTRISVIIPVHNGAEYLTECLASVQNQTAAPHEIIVIDDGSTDGSKAVIDRFDGINYTRTDHLGVAAARNLGIQKSTCEWIAFLDQDDYWTPDSIALRLGKSDGAIVIGRQKWFLDGLDNFPSWVSEAQMNKSLDGYLLGCALIQRGLFDRFGLFDTSFRFCSDFDWFFRLKDASVLFDQCDDIVLHKRIHAANESRHAKQSLMELSKALFKSVERKRYLAAENTAPR